MNKEEIYLDLSKFSKEKQKEVIGMLPTTKSRALVIIGSFYCLHQVGNNEWFVDYYYSDKLSNKTEVTYEQFKALINE